MFDILVLILAALCMRACAWIDLLFFRDGFWRCDQRLCVAGGEQR